MKVKEVFLLFLIIMLGVGLYYAQNFWLSIDGWPETLFYRGNSYSFEENQTLEAAPRLEIINRHGQVEVEGTDRENISLQVEKKIWQKDEEAARKVAEQIKILTTREGDQLLISTNREAFRKKNFAVDLKFYVPRNLMVKVRNSYGTVKIVRVQQAEVDNQHGQVDIFEISGPVKVINSYENLTLTDIGGQSQVETKHSSLLLSRLNGPVYLNCAHEEVELFDLRGPLNLESRHSKIKAVKLSGPSKISGTYEPISLSQSGEATIKGHHSLIEIDNLQGKLEIETSYESVKLTHLEGDLNIKSQSTELTLDSIKSQNINIESSYEEVKVLNFHGQLSLVANHGDISLDPVDLDYPITVKTEYSNLKFYWPDEQKARFEAISKGGNIYWQLPFPPEENQTNGSAIMKVFSQAQDRPEIKLSTSYG
ncbi:MAG: DUF4097 family beta strand repeat-containing protein, partial [Candidatus Saccharicenans sp.]